jgi:predicted metal-binding protein
MNSRLHLFVCTSCRPKGDPASPRPGQVLFECLSSEHAAWARRLGVTIEPTECLSVCPRPCGIALSAPEKWTYVFGDVKPGRDEAAVVECATLYARSVNGHLPREERPLVLRQGILARVPPRI